MTALNKRWIPKSVLCLQAGYTQGDLISDLVAGVTVGLVALPLAMAFGIASGVTPQAQLYTAVVAGFLISALGGSRLQIGGPTGAFVVIVAGIIATRADEKENYFFHSGLNGSGFDEKSLSKFFSVQPLCPLCLCG